MFSPDLFSQHNDHRIAFPRLILFSDYLFFQGRGDFDLTAIFLMQSTFGGFASTPLGPYADRREGEASRSAPWVPLLLFSLRQSENFVWGFRSGSCPSSPLAALAIVIFAKALERSRLGEGSGVATSIAYGLVAVATFSMSNGVVCSIVLIVMAVLARSSKRHIVGATVVTIALIAAFSFRYQFLAAHRCETPGCTVRSRFCCTRGLSRQFPRSRHRRGHILRGLRPPGARPRLWAFRFRARPRSDPSRAAGYRALHRGLCFPDGTRPFQRRHRRRDVRAAMPLGALFSGAPC